MKTTKMFVCGNLIDLSLIKSITYYDYISGITHNGNGYRHTNHNFVISFLSGEPIRIMTKTNNEETRSIYDALCKAWSGVDKSDIPVIDFKTS